MFNDKQIDDLTARLFDGISFTREPAGLYDPLRYMIRIGGKRIRPRLCLTTFSFSATTSMRASSPRRPRWKFSIPSR